MTRYAIALGIAWLAWHAGARDALAQTRARTFHFEPESIDGERAAPEGTLIRTRPAARETRRAPAADRRCCWRGDDCTPATRYSLCPDTYDIDVRTLRVRHAKHGWGVVVRALPRHRFVVRFAKAGRKTVARRYLEFHDRMSRTRGLGKARASE